METEDNKPRFKFEPDLISIIGLLLVLIGIISWLFDLPTQSRWVHSKTSGTQMGEAVQVPAYFIIIIGLVILLVMNWPIKTEESSRPNRFRKQLKRKIRIKPKE